MPNADKEVERYVRSCQVCQEASGSKNVACLSPISVENVMDKVGIDVLGPIRRSARGNRYIIVAVEYVSKYAICKAVARVTSEVIVDFLVEEIFCRFGGVREIISDRGSVFTARLVKETIEEFGAQAVYTTAFHPQSNGLVERFNRTLLSMLRKFIASDQRDWCRFLPMVTFAYNSSVQASTSQVPHLLLYGRDPRVGIDVDLGLNNVNAVTTLSQKQLLLESLTRRALSNLGRAQMRQKRMYDRKASCQVFRVGDLVLLHTPRRISGRTYKLCRLFKGPYIVVRRINERNYIVRKVGVRRAMSRLDVVHVNRMKLFHTRPVVI